MTVTLTNDFHKTEARVRIRDGRINRPTVQRIARELCPAGPRCVCGQDAANTRGGEFRVVEADPHGWHFHVVRADDPHANV